MKYIFLLLVSTLSLASQAQNAFKGANTYKGVQSYETNIGGAFTARSIPDKNYIDSSRNKARDSVVSLIIKDTLAKAITIESPSTSESKTLWFAKKAITLIQINDVLTGSSTPSVTWNIKYASTRDSGSPTSVFSSDRATTSTSGASTTTFANASIPAGSWIWLTTSANAGTVTDLNVTLTYTQ